MSMYPWHGIPNHSAPQPQQPHPHPSSHAQHAQHSNTSSAAQLHSHSHSHSTSTSSPSTPYQIPHSRWMPSMMSRQQPQQQQPQQQNQNTTSGSTNATPSISSNLRMGQNANHQAVSVVVETRPMPSSQGVRGPREEDVEGSEESDQDGGRGMAVLDGSGDPDYAPSLGAEGGSGGGRRRRRGGGVGGGGLAIVNDDRDNPIDEADINTANQLMAAGNNGESSERKHGKRLTTSEEVSLFEICNRHAPDFGQRSNLCRWWITVTAEFTRDQGHPYSWHSVRRKVELVTKQRMRFLEEQREKGAAASEDLSNARWRVAVDAWIPTWQKWEEAEARRIEKRDSRKTRKRKSRGWEFPWDTAVAPEEDDGWRAPSVDHTPTGTPGYNQTPVQVQPSVPVSSTPVPALPQSNVPVPVRLPPGFDSMFSNPNPSPQSPAPAPLAQKTPYQSTSPAPAVAATATATATSTEPNMMTALLETLGKLNKHLDANPDPRAALAPGQQNHHLNGNEHNTENIMSTPLSLLKEELKREVREELRREIERDRASLEERLDSVQRTQEMILEMLRQEPA